MLGRELPTRVALTPISWLIFNRNSGSLQNGIAAPPHRNIHRRLTGDSDTGYISTFHSFCVSVLQEDIYALQYPKSFLVLDNSDIDAMLKVIYEERGLTLHHMTFAKARDMIEIRKVFKDPSYYEHMIALPPDGLRLNRPLASSSCWL